MRWRRLSKIKPEGYRLHYSKPLLEPFDVLLIVTAIIVLALALHTTLEA